MSQGIRQSQLFAAEDWKSIYRAFTSVNFSAYDFDSIRDAMVSYIRTTFPEDFNDWIESSEFVAIIDLLAYLGQSLAFRMDINARENFIDTAERRESILRLARLLSYNPRRNFPATGLVKITQLITDEDIIDSGGINIANTPIIWDDANNPDWREQFILIMNAAFVSTTPFGRPSSDGLVGGINTQLYQMNNPTLTRPSYAFSANAGGENLPFEIVNPSFEIGGSFFERTPNPDSAFHMIYRNDGNGNASNNTGFFLMFKQGELRFEDFELTVPVENRVIDLTAESVNDTDVWVQEIDENSNIVNDWVKVPSVVGNNIIYNSLDKSVRKIFSVITRDRDQVSLRFADGRFGDAPSGIIRAWYRRSSGTEYELRPQDISGFQLNIPYVNARGETHNLGIQYALQYTVTNSQARETIEQIRRRAPEIHYAQDRMVNAQDYNVFPLGTNRAIKLKAVNRTYAGHNRFFDLNDPTGKYQNTNIFATDGIVYREFESKYTEEPLPTSKDSTEIIYDKIVPMLAHAELSNFFYWYISSHEDITSNPSDAAITSTSLVWRRATKALYSSTGVFGTSIDNPSQVGATVSGPAKYIGTGALVKFENAGWATVKSLRGDGTYTDTGASASGPGAVELDHAVASGDQAQYILPAFRTTFTATELVEIQEEIVANNTFGLRFDFEEQEWVIITSPNLNENADYSLANAGDTTLTNLDASWLIKVIYTPSAWKITCRGMHYIFESYKDARFFYVNEYQTVDLSTTQAVKDFVKVLGINTAPGAESEFGTDIKFELYDNFTYEDGYIEPRRVKIKPMDSDDDGAPDNPLAYDAVVFPDRLDEPWNISGIPTEEDWDYLVFWKKYTDNDGYEYYEPLVKDEMIKDWDTVTDDEEWLVDDIGYSITNGAFYVADEDHERPDTPVTDDTAYLVRFGRGLLWNDDGEAEGLKFQWKHFAPHDHRIDPSPSCIMDMFVLTREYYDRVQTWLATGRSTTAFPKPPTSEDLRQLFVDLNQSKMQADEIIYHPIKFKLLFGEYAKEELQVRFKVIKLPSATFSDGEIKSRVINAINEFFAVANWDFGESFYYTELSTYIHQSLLSEIASVVPVPLNEEAKFGNLFEIKCEPDEIFLSCATVADVQIITNFTQTSLRIGN